MTSRAQRITDSALFLAIELWGWVRFPHVALRYLLLALPHGRLPHLATPRSANDKFFWRKVFDHDPRFTILCGKLQCKEWVRSLGLDLEMAPVLWVGTDPREIPESLLQGDVAVKANGGSATNLFIRNGHFDPAQLLQTTRRWLREPYGLRQHEWGYFNVPRNLFVESMIRPANGTLDELKLYTFGDRVERVVYILGRFGEIEASIWEPDEDGQFVRSQHRAAVAQRISPKPLPTSIQKAMDHARAIGRHFDHMRVDLYTDGERLWFGELTVYNLAGRMSITGHDPNSPFSRAWDIRRSAFLRNPPRQGWRNRYARALIRWLERQVGRLSHEA
jgi:hypothetical protein